MIRHHRQREQRIIFLTWEPSPGAARYVSELASSLAVRRDVRVLRASSPGGHRVEEGPLAARVWRNLRSGAAMLLGQFRSLRRDDIIHVQFLQPFPLGLAPFVLARVMGGKIVFTAHDPVPHRWMLPGRLAHLERRSLEWAYRVSHRVIVHNKSGAQFLQSEFGLAASKVTVIPHGAFHIAGPTAPFPKFDSLKLLCFGSIRENKGLHIAIEAVQRLNRGYGRRVRLTIAGEVRHAGEQEYWQRCKRLIQAQPEGIWVIERYIGDREVGPLLAEHHALLLPYQTYWSESRTACLALSNGRAILASESGGLGALLAESGGGMIIEGKSAGSVARAIQNAFLAGPEQLSKMGANGRQYMMSQRSWDAIARDTEVVYDKLREVKPEALVTLAGAAQGGR